MTSTLCPPIPDRIVFVVGLVLDRLTGNTRSVKVRGEGMTADGAGAVGRLRQEDLFDNAQGSLPKRVSIYPKTLI